MERSLALRQPGSNGRKHRDLDGSGLKEEQGLAMMRRLKGKLSLRKRKLEKTVAEHMHSEREALESRKRAFGDVVAKVRELQTLYSQLETQIEEDSQAQNARVEKGRIASERLWTQFKGSLAVLESGDDRTQNA